MGPLEDIIETHGVSCMLYADDTQVYLSFNSRDADIAITQIENCVKDIKSWMIMNSLMLNDGKTELIHFSSRFLKTPTDIPFIRVNNCDITPLAKARDLGITLDSHLTMSNHVNNLCSSASFGLYKIGRIRHLLDQYTTERLVHAFISSKLDSCNSLLFGLPDTEISKLQRVQNSATRLVTRVKGRAHMKPILRQLHWLPVRQRITFKVLLITL